MGLFDRIYWTWDTLRERRHLARTLRIGPRDLVLDVGSGGSPNPRSDVLCDLYPDDSSERGGQSARVDRPFVIGTVERLPFSDQAFDFVICSHLLEHVADPLRAVGELTRVAPRGYIETPAAAFEKLAGFPFHRWLVRLDGDTLEFEAKPAPIWDPELKEWFEQVTARRDVGRRIWADRRLGGILVSLSWEKVIKARVKPGSTATAPLGRTVTHESTRREPGALSAFIFDRSSRAMRRNSTRSWKEIECLLRCPGCRGGLVCTPIPGYRCLSCGRHYPNDATGHPRLVDETPNAS